MWIITGMGWVEKRQGGVEVHGGFPSIGFFGLGVGGMKCCVEGGRRWRRGQGAEGRGHGRMDLFIVGVGGARPGGFEGTVRLGRASTAVFAGPQDLALVPP